jgi:hypothetical protein
MPGEASSPVIARRCTAPARQSTLLAIQQNMDCRVATLLAMTSGCLEIFLSGYFGEIRDLARHAPQRRQQREAILPDGGIIGIDHHRLEEGI